MCAHASDAVGISAPRDAPQSNLPKGGGSGQRDRRRSYRGCRYRTADGDLDGRKRCGVARRALADSAGRRSSDGFHCLCAASAYRSELCQNDRLPLGARRLARSVIKKSLLPSTSRAAAIAGVSIELNPETQALSPKQTRPIPGRLDRPIGRCNCLR